MTAIMGRPSMSLSELKSATTAISYPKDQVASSLLTGLILPALWTEAVDHGIDPVVMLAQCAHETNWARFTGAVSPRHYNTCGLKVNSNIQGLYPEASGDLPMAHATFASWNVGARAHAQHLRAYCFVPVSPYELIVDPRYGLVHGPPCYELHDLNGRWAGPQYGDLVESIVTELRAVVGSMAKGLR
jgi:hypothetical protein